MREEARGESRILRREMNLLREEVKREIATLRGEMETLSAQAAGIQETLGRVEAGLTELRAGQRTLENRAAAADRDRASIWDFVRGLPAP